jgi:NADP-dependent 3-hydroxy acid dehydrogenase YdfG
MKPTVERENCIYYWFCFGNRTRNCPRFAKEGAHIACCDLNLEGAKKTAQEIQSLGQEALAIQLDVTQSKK